MITHFPDDILPREIPVLEKAADDAWKWVVGQRYRSEIKRFGKTVQLNRPNVKVVHQDQSFYHPASNSIFLGIDRTEWVTYNRDKLGMTAFTEDISPAQLWTITLIHEYTHAIQRWRLYCRNRTTGCSRYHFSELETTRNEFTYAAHRWPKLLLRSVSCFNERDTDRINSTGWRFKTSQPSRFMINLLVHAVNRHKQVK